jgi:hypothetical protein
MRELEAKREVSERPSDDRQAWCIASAPACDRLAAHGGSMGLVGAPASFSASRHPCGRWIEQRRDEPAGLDLNESPAGITLPEPRSAHIVS